MEDKFYNIVIEEFKTKSTFGELNECFNKVLNDFNIAIGNAMNDRMNEIDSELVSLRDNK